MTIDQQRMEHAERRNRFEYELARFCAHYGPKDLYERDRFHQALMMLMRDAMQYQTNTFGRGVENYASMALQQASMQPLQAIFYPPKEPKP